MEGFSKRKGEREKFKLNYNIKIKYSPSVLQQRSYVEARGKKNCRKGKEGQRDICNHKKIWELRWQ